MAKHKQIKATKKTPKNPTPSGGRIKANKADRPEDGGGWGFPTNGAGATGNTPTVGRRRVHDLETVAKALANNNGIKKYAAEQLGISARSLSDYIDRFPSVWNAYLDAREEMLDIAEHNFFKIIKQPHHKDHFGALRFFLETVGRHRGYNSRIEFDLRAGGDNIGGELDLSRLTLDQMKTFQKLLELATVETTGEFADFEVITNETE